jgi:calpain-7
MAIEAAQLAMNGIKLSRSPETQTLMTKKSKYFLDEADRIKSASEWKSLSEVNVEKVTVLIEPKSDRKLPTSEQIILLRASQLNGFKFPPWTNAPQDSDFRLSSGQEPFT